MMSLSMVVIAAYDFCQADAGGLGEMVWKVLLRWK